MVIRVYKTFGAICLILFVSLPYSLFGAPEETKASRQLLMKDVAQKIAQLSPAKPVLGGKWFVTKFSFATDKDFYVDYEDGHIMRRILVKSVGTVEQPDYKIIGFFEPGKTMDSWVLKSGQDTLQGKKLEAYIYNTEKKTWIRVSKPLSPSQSFNPATPSPWAPQNVFSGVAYAAEQGQQSTPWQSPLAVDRGIKLHPGTWGGAMAAVAFDSQGNPAVAYYYPLKGLRYAHYNGKDWTKAWVDQTTARYTFPHYIALSFITKGSNKGQPRIFYKTIKDFKYASSANGKSWQTKVVLTRPGKKEKYLSPSLALDHFGNPAIAYIDRDTRTVKVKFKAGTKAYTSEISKKGEFPQHLSLAFDSQKNPGLAYLDNAKNVNVMKFNRFNGTKWNDKNEKVNITYHPLVKGKNIRNIFLKFNSQREPGIAFTDGRRVRYAHRVAGKWQAELVAQKGRCISLAFDPKDQPVIAYLVQKEYDRAQPPGKKAQELKYAFFHGNKWHTESVTPGKDFALPTFALNKEGNPIISYYDPTKDMLMVAAKMDYAPAPKKLEIVTPIISGVVKDALTGESIKDAKFYTSLQSALTLNASAVSDNEGKYEIKQTPELFKNLRVDHPDYHTRKIPLSFEGEKGKKPITVNVLLHPKKYMHTTVKVSEKQYNDSKKFLTYSPLTKKVEKLTPLTKVIEKQYQVTFTQEDTAEPQKKLLKARIFSLEQDGTTFEDKEIDLTALETEKRKGILLPAHMWIFLNYPISGEYTGFDYLRKVSTLNRSFLRAAVKDYKDTKQKAQIRNYAWYTIQTLKNLDDLKGVFIAVGTKGWGPVATEVTKVLIGNTFTEDPIIEGMFEFTADKLLGKDIDKYPEHRQKAIEHFFNAEYFFQGKDDELYQKALNCLPSPPDSWKKFLATYEPSQNLQTKVILQSVPEGNGLGFCVDFQDTKDYKTARAIKVNVTKALESMVEGFMFLEKLFDRFEGKQGFWRYKSRENSQEVPEPTGSRTLDLKVPRKTVAIKIYSILDPILRGGRSSWDLEAVAAYGKHGKKAKVRLSKMASYQYNSSSNCYNTNITATDNRKDEEAYASLIFDKPLDFNDHNTLECTMKFKLDGPACRAIKRASPKEPIVYINYLLETSATIEQTQKPFKELKTLIDNLGETNEQGEIKQIYIIEK